MKRIVDFGWIVLSCCLLASPAAGQSASIESVSFQERADKMGYMIRVATSDTLLSDHYNVDIAEDGSVIVTIMKGEIASEIEQEDPPQPITGYDAHLSDSGAEITFSLDPSVPVIVAYYPDQNLQDLMVSLTYDLDEPPDLSVSPDVAEASETSSGPAEPSSDPTEEDEEEQAQAASEVVQDSTSQQPLIQPTDPEPVAAIPATQPAPETEASGAPGLSDLAALESQASDENWKLDTIVIDPGHGGVESGTTWDGVEEKTITLEIARKLGQLIESNMDVKVVYTRTTDENIELAERGHIANEAGGKLFLSIHANSTPSASRRRSAAGTEVYFLGLHRTESAREVMERENSVIKRESNPDLYVSMDEDAAILQSLAQSAYLTTSEQLAELIDEEFQNTAGRNSRGVKQAGFQVLWEASMPAVLIEVGYVSNPRESAYMTSEAGQKALARSIFNALRTFKDLYERAVKGEIGG